MTASPPAADVPDLSVVIPALHEGENLALLLPALRAVLQACQIDHEILIVTNDLDPATERAAKTSDARVLMQRERGYGGALLSGFAESRGRFVLTMDADLSHPAEFLRALWERRHEAEVIIASRYVPGGRAEMPLGRFVLSKILNRVFSRGLSLRVRDMSSGFRLFHAHVVRGQPLIARDFDVVQEILVRAYANGWRVAEVPFRYEPRRHGSSHARVLKFGLAYIRTFRSLWRLRNSAACADYDARAYDSVIPLQRFWQRSRVRHILDLVSGAEPVLDVGCGSSRVLEGLPARSVGLDIRLPKLRYVRRYGRPLVQASALALPFRNGLFSTVVCSQVIEHVPKNAGILDELDRVLRPGGRLVIGTPDYAQWQWRALERLYLKVVPGGYADDHIAPYTREELVRLVSGRGYQLEATRYILGSELIVAFRKALG